MEKNSYDWKIFKLPISKYHTDSYYVSGDSGPIENEDEIYNSEVEMLNYELFEQIYYFDYNDDDGKTWKFVVKHKNNYYIYFQAHQPKNKTVYGIFSKFRYSRFAKSIKNILPEYVKNNLIIELDDD